MRPILGSWPQCSPATGANLSKPLPGHGWRGSLSRRNESPRPRLDVRYPYEQSIMPSRAAARVDRKKVRMFSAGSSHGNPLRRQLHGHLLASCEPWVRYGWRSPSCAVSPRSNLLEADRCLPRKGETEDNNGQGWEKINELTRCTDRKHFRKYLTRLEPCAQSSSDSPPTQPHCTTHSYRRDQCWAKRVNGEADAPTRRNARILGYGDSVGRKKPQKRQNRRKTGWKENDKKSQKMTKNDKKSQKLQKIPKN